MKKIEFFRQNLICGVLSILISTLLINCSPTKLMTEPVGLERPFNPLGFFHYTYPMKPNLYASLALVFPTESIGNFALFSFYGIIAPADGTNDIIKYQVSLTDDSGQSICVGDSGVLNADQQNITFNCLGSLGLLKANVTLTASYKGQEEVFKAVFSK